MLLAVAVGATVPVAAAAQASRITPALMQRHIAVLADDSMRGRRTPSPELERAADYAEGVLRRVGVRPAGEGGTYRQRFPASRDTLLGEPSAPNLVAVSPGQGPLAGEYVAVVAHFDHVGVGRPLAGDSIYNGADDNASGTAGVLALAEAFGAGATSPRRSILFLLVSGEERGLLGSRWYAGHPTVPLDRVVGLVNLDMISRNRPDSVYLNGWGKSTISDLVRRLATEHTELGLGVGPDEEDRPVTPADSDHYPFQRLGIPYIFFYTGPHADYHRAGDHADRTDSDKAARVARLAYYTLAEMAGTSERPAWTPEARSLNVLGPTR